MWIMDSQYQDYKKKKKEAHNTKITKKRPVRCGPILEYWLSIDDSEDQCLVLQQKSYKGWLLRILRRRQCLAE